jgi:hypothetical protein
VDVARGDVHGHLHAAPGWSLTAAVASARERQPDPSCDPPRGTRRRLADIPARFHCSLIGTCLTTAEVRSLARRAGVARHTSGADFELHAALVHSVDRDRTARVLQRHLDGKFAGEIRRFGNAADEPALAALWRESLEGGDLAGGYWALLSHPLAGERLLDEAHGQVHMLSHVAATRIRAMRRELEAAREGLQAKNALLNQAWQKQSEQDDVIRQLRDRLAVSQREARDNIALRARLQRFEKGETFATLRDERNRLAADLERSEAGQRHWLGQLDAARIRIDRLSRALTASERSRRELERMLSRRTMDTVADPLAHGRDEAVDLAGRCVAYIGGRERLFPRLRAFTEDRNGRFVYHDGGLEDGRARLADVLEGADMVLCPLDCVSHDACERLKRHCRERGKPFVLLRSASLSAFAAGLREITAS